MCLFFIFRKRTEIQGPLAKVLRLKVLKYKDFKLDISFSNTCVVSGIWKIQNHI